MTVNFKYLHGTKIAVAFEVSVALDFVNLKNKSEGARRYGYRGKVLRFENVEGQVAFRSDYQTTLNGGSYQASKHGEFVATHAEALAALDKTIAGATKRYAKLALDPIKNKIEARPA